MSVRPILSLLLAALLSAPVLLAQPADTAAVAPKKMKKIKGAKSLFLISRGLPHYTMAIKKHWNDPKLALSAQQKKALEAVRKETLGTIRSLAPAVKKLRKKIVKAAKKGADPATLQNDVARLAELKTKATMAHLRCLHKTQSILTPEQLAYLKKVMKKKHRKKSR